MNFNGKHCPKCGKIPRKKGRKYICRCGWSYTEPGEDYDDTVTQNLNILTSSYSSSLLQDLYNYNSYTMDTSKWIWVTGYKGTDANMTCRDMKYSLGDRYDLPESISPVLCTSGFHFCLKLKEVFRYYDIMGRNRFFEVEALVRESDYIRAKENIDSDTRPSIGIRGNFSALYFNDVHDTKIAAKSIIFTKELTTDELLSMYPLTSEWTDEIKDLARHIGVKRAHYKFESKLLLDAGFEADVVKLIHNLNASQQALKAVATYGAVFSKMMNAVFGRSHETSDNE